MKRYGLAHSERLHAARDFRAVFGERKRQRRGPFVLHWQAGGEQSRPRLGIIASARYGNAVERNRAKRLVRDIFRHRKSALMGGNYVCRICEPLVGFSPLELRAALETLFKGVEKKDIT